MGAGLTATAWAPDGTVEAFEDADERFLVGVQWHAEGLTGLDRHAALFRAFVDACRDGAPAASREPVLMPAEDEL